eukprot:s781_g5.t2
MAASEKLSTRSETRSRRRCWMLLMVGAMIVQVTEVKLFVAPRESVDLDRRKALTTVVASSTVAVEPAWAGDVFAKRAKQANDAAAKPIEKVDQFGRELVEIARPKGMKKKLYSFDLPVIPGKVWGDYSKQDLKELGVIFKGKFGNETENAVLQSQVLAGPADAEYIESIRSKIRGGFGATFCACFWGYRAGKSQMLQILNYTEGYGILRDQESPGQIDLEWTDFERRRRTYYKVHNFMRVLRDLSNNEDKKDVLILFSMLEPQVENLQSLWTTVRDSLKLGR